jgi:succinyl-diaminopimelate desuccinylase
MQAELTSRPALGPTNGGTGELEKSNYLKQAMSRLGLKVTEFRCPDKRVPCGYRPSLVGFLPGGDHSRRVWIMTHMDVVPPGPRELWKTDPYRTRVIGDRLYGRGVEDNQQEMVASIHAVKALRDLGLTPACDVGLVLVADEETGSYYGIDYVIRHEKRFRPQDLIIVADAGNNKGSEIEVAEKSIAWLKFTVAGHQTHGSTPHKGRNAHRAGAQLMLRIDRLLHRRYPAREQLFHPPFSTAEPTKHEPNVPNINTIPGEDIFYFDCRVLPRYSVKELLLLVRAEAAVAARELGVKVRVSTEQFEQAAPPTSPGAPVVKVLSRAVRDVYGVRTSCIGIGGGTVAAFFRRAGYPAAVWGRFCGQAHQPNEYCLISNMLGDSRVYAHILGQEA